MNRFVVFIAAAMGTYGILDAVMPVIKGKDVPLDLIQLLCAVILLGTALFQHINFKNT